MNVNNYMTDQNFSREKKKKPLKDINEKIK